MNYFATKESQIRVALQEADDLSSVDPLSITGR